jgi:hypothetical protein
VVLELMVEAIKEEPLRDGAVETRKRHERDRRQDWSLMSWMRMTAASSMVFNFYLPSGLVPTEGWADDLPVIRENIRQGFIETQTKVNSWVAALKKKIDGEEEEDFPSQARPDQRYQSQQYAPRRSGEGRRSADRERYDADPQVLGDDFSALELRDAEGKSSYAETAVLQ